MHSASTLVIPNLILLWCMLQVAAELQSADEMVLSELVFDGTFSDANAEQVVALLASVVWREHGSEDNAKTKLREDLKPVLKALHAAAHRVAKVRLQASEDQSSAFHVSTPTGQALWCRLLVTAKSPVVH